MVGKAGAHSACRTPVVSGREGPTRAFENAAAHSVISHRPSISIGPPCHKRTQQPRRPTTKVRSNPMVGRSSCHPASPCARPVVQAAAPRRKMFLVVLSRWPLRQRNRYRRRRSHPKTPRFGSDGHLEFDFVHERHMQGRVHSPSMEDDRAGDRNAMAVEMPLTLLRCNRSARSSTRTLPDARHDERARSHRSPGQYTVGAAPSLTTSDPAACGPPTCDADSTEYARRPPPGAQDGCRIAKRALGPWP
jgi:hypothetical protein